MTLLLPRAPPHPTPSQLAFRPLAACRRLLDAEQRLPVLLLLSVLVSALYCRTMFDGAFLAGTSAFWRAPHGVVPNSWADMSTALSGYDYFIRDGWRLPLFQVTRLGAPGGTNIIYTDSTPVVALLGRVLFRLTNRPINLFGGWTVLCFCANGASMTLLVGRLGGRTLPAALAATVFGLCAPALLARWGHTTLMAQFEVVLALALYVDVARADRPLRPWLWSFPLCAVALWTHAYLFAMVAPIVAVALVQPLLDRRLRLVPAVAAVAGLVGLMAVMLVASGYLTAGTLSAGGFGTMSVNLLAPVYPDVGMVGALLHLPRLDVTGYQGEGCCYLGAGALLLLVCTSRSLTRQLRGRVNRHACLTVLLLAYTAFAVSNEIFLGYFHLGHVPLPEMMLGIAGIFRASGRFIWPAMYLVMALAAAGCAIEFKGRPASGLLLLAAASLQFIDTMPLRGDVALTTRTSLALPIDAAAWEAAVPQHDFVRLLPAFGCVRDNAPPPLVQIFMQVQLIAGRFDVPTNSVYTARGETDCAPVMQPPPLGALTFYWLGHTPAPPAGGASCDTAYGVAVCSGRLSSGERRALLPTGSLD